MFGNKKKNASAIDPEQKELIENARRRIKQKRLLFTHFVVFLIGSLGLIIIANRPNVADIPRILDIQWWIWVIFLWLLLLAYHAFNVFITNRLLGPEWEKRQYDLLVQKQKDRIAQLEKKVQKEFVAPKTKLVLDQPESQRKITMIAAAGANNELGKDGDLVWHLPDDFRRFKELTTGHHIIMGRKTFESFPKPLPNRTHIILTKDTHYKTKAGIVVHDLETALATAAGDDQPFIIGGGEIYKQFLPMADVIELTRVHGSFESDTFFPNIDESKWKLVNSLHHPADDKHKHSFDYETWVRK
ncbi:dihydrofolate reductase [Nonlabens xiamenensis]|uniref:dihydrofolate reductase n=1 Tax=Nonlabens xiamenensis TaxID=2341043 RepID=UPI000F60B886|nr:dihydrofolate reductase [Nonlabens xiamenensis]